MKFNEIKRMLAEDPWDLFYRLSKSEAQKIFTEAIYSLRDDQSYEEFIDSIEEMFDDGQELSFKADDGKHQRKTYAEYRKQEEDFRHRLLEKDPGLKYDDSEIDKAIFYKWLEKEIFNSNKQDQNSKIESILKEIRESDPDLYKLIGKYSNIVADELTLEVNGFEKELEGLENDNDYFEDVSEEYDKER